MTFSPGFPSAMQVTWTCSAPFAPPPTCSRSVHSRADGQSALRPRRYHPPKSRSALVVSHHLDGFLRFSSRGLVASRCRSWGPPRFHTGRPTGRPASHDASPQCRIRTLRRNPRRQPYRVTAALTFVPFPRDHRPRSRRAVAGVPSVEVGGSKAPAPRPCSIVGSGIGPHRCRHGRPTPSWASFLFKVLPSGRRSRLPPPHTIARAPEGEARWQAPFRTRRATDRSRPRTEHRPRGEPRERGHRARWAGAWTTATHDPKTAATAAYAAGTAEAEPGCVTEPGRPAPKCERRDPIPAGIPPTIHRACVCTARPTDWRTSGPRSRRCRRTCGADDRCRRSLSGAEVARGVDAPQVALLRAGDPRRPS